MLEIVLIAIVVTTGAALAGVAWWQRKKLWKRFRLQIVNRGNVQSRYALRADDPHDALVFAFSLDGSSLPIQGRAIAPDVSAVDVATPAPSRAPATREDTRGIGDWGSGLSQTVADGLSALGRVLPGSAGASLTNMASRLRRGRAMTRRLQRLPGQPGRPRAAAPRPPAVGVPQAKPSVPAGKREWVQTPYVEAGETLVVDLLIRPRAVGRSQHWPFRVLSRSVEQDEAPLVIEEGSVQMAGGFWARRFAPYLAIVSSAIGLLLLAFWLASIGVLAPWW